MKKIITYNLGAKKAGILKTILFGFCQKILIPVSS